MCDQLLIVELGVAWHKHNFLAVYKEKLKYATIKISIVVRIS